MKELDGTSELTWKPLGISRLKEILRSPIYAGAYAWGRRSEKKILVDGEIRTVRQSKAPDEWAALIEGAHEGYISAIDESRMPRRIRLPYRHSTSRKVTRERPEHPE